MCATSCKFGFVMLVFLSASAVVAQPTLSNWGQLKGGYQSARALPPEFGFSYHHASTANEGWLRGWGQVIHATGNFWLSYSQAAIMAEQARSLRIDNQQRWIACRVWARERQAADRNQRIEALRLHNEARRSTQFEAAYRLSLQDFDSTTGAIEWPAVLCDSHYAKSRSQLNDLFFRRSQRYGSPNGFDAEILRSIESLREELRRNVGLIGRNEFANAQRFLCGLKQEIESPRPFENVGNSSQQNNLTQVK